MKTITLLFLLIFTSATIHAQNYLISFAGSGDTSQVGTVIVENLTSGATLTLNGGDILQLIGVVGIDEAIIQNRPLHVYPNPFTEQSILTVSAPENGNAVINIVDVSGRTVFQLRTTLSAGTHSYRILGLSQGMYFIRITGKNYTYSTKLISQSNHQSEAKIEHVSSVANTRGNPVKSTATTIDMPYTEGDILLYKSISGQYSTIVTDMPTGSKTITFNFVLCKDNEGRNYSTVTIGTQTWMAENLAYLPGVSPPTVGSATEPYYYVYAYDGTSVDGAKATSNYETYGVLYNWPAALAACPTGWHLPSDTGWTTLENYLIDNGYNYDGTTAGNKIAKSLAATTNWDLSYGTGTVGDTSYPAYRNKIGFSGLPGGYRNANGTIYGIGTNSPWWSSTESADSSAWYRSLGYYNTYLNRNYSDKSLGFSVRCLKDTSSLPVASGDEPLTAEEADFLASVPDTLIHLEDIILENGDNVRSFLEKYDPGFLTSYPSLKSSSAIALTPFLQKVMYTARMLGMGNHLVNDALHTYPSEGANKPAQTGLAYSWGSKDDTIRQKPPTILIPGCNDKYIHGLDCSGMIWQMIQAANLNPPPVPKYNFFVSYITDAPKWTAAFKASADYKDLKMKDMGENYSQHDMKNGDMILWRKHVGIYLYGNFYQSNGDPNAPGCTYNLAQDKGPRCVSLSNILSWKKLGAYHVFRPVYDDKYTLTLTINSTGFGATTPACILGNYIDSTVFKITVSTDNIVTLDSIKNSNPPVTYQSAGGCDCLGMTFSNGSVYEFTGLTATVTENGSLNDFLECYFIQTFCSSNDSIQCPNTPPMFFPGMVVPGNIMTAGINIPQAWEPITITSGQGITLTIKRDLQ